MPWPTKRCIKYLRLHQCLSLTYSVAAQHCCCLFLSTECFAAKFFRQESLAIAKTTARCAIYIAALKILESP